MILALALATACSAGPEAAQDKGRAARDARPGTALAEGVAVANAGVAEPSGIAFHAARQRFYVVGDEGTLAELDADGGFVAATAIGANLEDVAVHDPTGNLVLLDEVKGELLLFDLASRRVERRWALDAQELVGRKEKRRDGFEGLAFRPEAGRPGGGVFYLAHQRGPATLVAVTFDPASAGGTVGAANVVGRWPMPGRGDLTAVSWSPAVQRLLLLADAEDELVMLDVEGREQGRMPIGGVQQEGVALDARGDLWVADDRGTRVVRHAGALAAIKAVLERGPATGTAQGPGEKKRKKND
jgi:uncharacterized protein YjiK